MSSHIFRRPQNRSAFEIAIFCALPFEADAIISLFDASWEDEEQYEKADGDTNSYFIGQMGQHPVVLVQMAHMGKISAANVAANLRMSFPRIKLGLLVGVCGAVPFDDGREREILLGDVIISTRIVEADFGRQYPDKFVRKNTPDNNLGRPNIELRGFLSTLQTKTAHTKLEDLTKSILDKEGITYPGVQNDVLFEATYRHKHHDNMACSICARCKNPEDSICEDAIKLSCAELKCDIHHLIPRARIRKAMDEGQIFGIPAIHFGVVASGDQVIKSAQHRNHIAQEEGVIAFEMEGAGLWETIPTLVVKGVCDYADSHKSKGWQPYAAAAAAACTKVVLRMWRPTTRSFCEDDKATSLSSPLNLTTLPPDLIDQNTSGAFNSQAHRLNGNDFYGKFHTKDSDSKSRTGAQDNSRRKLAKQGYSELEGGFMPSLVEGLSWDDCVQSLAFKGSKHREGVIDTNAEGTCEWLFESPEYLQWADEHGLFLIKGKPGSGKSTLLKFALMKEREAAKHSGALVISFFFYANGTELQSGLEGFFRSSLLQIIDMDGRSKSSFYEHCCKRYNAERSNDSLSWHYKELQGIFENLVLECSNRRKTIVFVDAIDECKYDRDDLISFFFHLKGQEQMRKIKPRIFFTCRIHPGSQFNADFQIRLEDKNQNDIQNYIEHTLQLPNETEPNRNELKQTLQKNAQGLFLWLVLVIPQVRNMSSKGMSLKLIKSEIRKCPRTLDELYDSLLHGIEERELLEAGRLFQWICFAIRPLSLDELRVAMTVHMSGTLKSLGEYANEDNECYIENEHKMKQKMIHLSKGLVDVIDKESAQGKSEVGFHHETIKSFMLTKGLNYINNRLKESQRLAETANAQLANTCVDYISTTEIQTVFSKKQLRFPTQFLLLDYAATYWTTHAICAEKNVHGDFKWPSQSILNTWIRICKISGMKSTECPKEGTTLLHISAEHGLERLARSVIASRKVESGSLQHNQPLARSKPRMKFFWENDKNSKKDSPILQNRSLRRLPQVARPFKKVSQKEQTCESRQNAIIYQKNEEGKLPVHLAAHNGHLEIVNLLQHMSDLSTTDKVGRTPLYSASNSGHLEVVKFLYEHGAQADIHTPNNKGWTPLNAASSRGYLEVVKFLYEHGAQADIHTPNNDGWTPLYSASNSGHLEVAKFLYEHGTQVDIHIPSNNGRSPLNAASSRGYLEVVKFLLDHGADINTPDNGWTPLNKASSRGYLEVVKFLYEHGADINIPNNDGWTPLNIASIRGHLEVVKFLYEHGADINIPNNDGWTPLNAASSRGYLEVVKFLLDHGADINTPDNGRTPLNIASSRGHLEVVKFLYEHGADINIPNNDGWTPLNKASSRGHLEVVKFLYEHGADINTPSHDGWTPLNIASGRGHLEVVKFLYKYGAQANIYTSSHDGWTPLNAASSRGHLKVVKFLYEHGADVQKPNNDGWTALHAASESGHLEVVKFLYEHGADIHTPSHNGWTPLFGASDNGHLEVVKFLYEHGAQANIYIHSYDGWTPLNAASSRGHLEVVKFLYEQGADINTPNNDGWTPLNIASSRGHLEMVKFLYEHGADIHKPTNGWTPLNIASSRGHLEVVKFLYEHGA